MIHSSAHCNLAYASTSLFKGEQFSVNQLLPVYVKTYQTIHRNKHNENLAFPIVIELLQSH